MFMSASTLSLHALVGPARGRLLQALRAGSSAGVHVRELARGAGLSLSSVQKELDRLSALGVLHRTAAANRVLHGLRHRDPFVKLLMAAAVALEHRGIRFTTLPADRAAEKAFVEFCAWFPPDAELWRQYGDPQLLAGVAVLLAGHQGFERPAYLALAEALHAGAGTVGQFKEWHRTHRPDLPRLLAMIDRERRTHARAHDQ